jgi:putative membrane protein
MQRLILRWAINAIALWIAITFVPGITGNKEWWAILGLALIFGLVNALLRPLLKLLTCPLLILTLGLGTLLINTLLFWLSGMIGLYFGVGFVVHDFWAAFLGALLVSVVSFILSVFVKDGLEGRRRPRRPRE